MAGSRRLAADPQRPLVGGTLGSRAGSGHWPRELSFPHYPQVNVENMKREAGL
jgi:hypothetical protein